MTKLVWRQEPPDCDGLWAATDCADDPVPQAHYCIRGGRKINNYWKHWCRICDLPEISKPIQYRDVTIADLLNGPIEYEVSDDGAAWLMRRLVGYVHENSGPFRVSCGERVVTFKYARIAIDPTKAEVKSRQTEVLP